MSEAAPARGVVVSHGALAEGLVDAVRQIVGAQADGLVPVSNMGLSPEALAQRIAEAAGGGPAVVFTDLQSGSCALAARRLQHLRSEFIVISGVNLPALLDFVTHRDLPITELVPRLLERGRAGIGCSPGNLEADADRSVPDR
jgi:mannose/fructose-specific phosphotransferase system component IIA